MKHEWEVNVGNVGNVWRDYNGFEAIREYWQWVAVSKGTAEGMSRAEGEPVTLTKNGEPFYQYDPAANWWYIEVTDTWGGPSGETNYCWVRRYKVYALTEKGALRRINEGYYWRFDHDTGESSRYNAKGACVCCFVEKWEEAKHGDRMFVKEVP
jgi:hypothetical protein